MNITSTKELDSLKEQFEFEKQARQRILEASPEERYEVINQVYSELYSRFQFANYTRSNLEQLKAEKIHVGRLYFLPHIKPNMKVLELACGSAIFLTHVAKQGIDCTGIDTVINKQLDDEKILPNLSLTEGNAAFPKLSETFDIIYSNQFVEHLHPDDVLAHFIHVRSLLKLRGKYVIYLPSRLMGPGDISKFFNCTTAEGLHLKEWLYNELEPLILQAGYRKAKSVLLSPKWTFYKPLCIPIKVKCLLEKVFAALPRKLRLRLGYVLCFHTYIILETV